MLRVTSIELYKYFQSNTLVMRLLKWDKFFVAISLIIYSIAAVWGSLSFSGFLLTFAFYSFWGGLFLCFLQFKTQMFVLGLTCFAVIRFLGILIGLLFYRGVSFGDFAHGFIYLYFAVFFYKVSIRTGVSDNSSFWLFFGTFVSFSDEIVPFCKRIYISLRTLFGIPANDTSLDPNVVASTDLNNYSPVDSFGQAGFGNSAMDQTYASGFQSSVAAYPSPGSVGEHGFPGSTGEYVYPGSAGEVRGSVDSCPVVSDTNNASDFTWEYPSFFDSTDNRG